MIQLIKRAEVNDTDIPLLSRWQSNRLPYIFELQRKDILVTSITNYNGTALIQVALPSTINEDVNYQIILNSINGIYKNAVGVIISTYVSGAYSYAVTTIQYGGNESGGYYNTSRKEAYRTSIRLIGVTPTTNQVTEFGTLYGTPNASGLSKMDISGLLSYAMQKQNLFPFNVRNLKDIYSYLSFKIYYNATYNIGIYPYTEFPNDIADTDGKTPITYYAIDGVKNLLQQYGQNFADFLVTYKEREVKFLTEFQTPTYFVGFPFALNFIFDSSLAINKQGITLEEDEFDSTGNNTNHYDDYIDKSQNSSVNHLMITGNYQAGTEYVEVWLEANGTAGEYYVAENYVADFYTDDVTSGSSPAIRITEKKKVYVDANCRKNPIYLMWKNGYGGWSYWLFDNNTEETFVAKHNTDYSIYIENIETANLKNKFVNVDQVKTITCGDNVRISDLYGLAGIEKSPQVFMLYDASKLATNPSLAWIGVNVLPKGFKYSPLAERVDVEVTFELPSYYTIPN